MASVSVSIQGSLNGETLTGSVSAQVSQLEEIARLIKGLTQSPPQDVRDALRRMADFRMPNMDFAASLSPMLGRISAALPAEFSGALGDLPSRLEHLSATISGQLQPDLLRVLGVIRAVQDLATLDFQCNSDLTGSAGGAAPAQPPPPPPPPPPPGGPPPGQPGESASTPATRAAASALTALERLPSPLEAPTLVMFVREVVSRAMQGFTAPFPIPILQEIFDPLETLARWDAMTSGEIATHMAQTLTDAASLIRDEVRGSLNATATRLAAMNTLLAPADLLFIAETLSSRLDLIREAVNSGDVSGTGPAVAEINAVMDRLDDIRTAFDAAARTEAAALADTLPRLAERVEAKMDHVVFTLSPSAGLGHLAALGGEINTPEDPQAIAELREQMRVLTGWLEDLIERLDVSALEAGLAPAAAAVREAVEAIDAALISATLAVRERFAQAESAIDAVDTAAVRQAMERVLTAARNETTGRLRSFLDPVRGAISTAMGTVGDAVDEFDPSAVVDALRDVVERLAGVLDSPEISGPLGTIRTAVEQAASGVESFSFTPAVDPVVVGIDSVTEKLKAINPDELSDSVKFALAGAVAILPDDLNGPIGELTVGFDGIVQAGPVQLVEQAKAGPAAVMDSLKAFEPAVLIGDKLSRPFTTAVSEAEKFRPRELFKQVDAEIAKVRKRIADTASPTKALEPLQKEFEKLLKAVDGLNPAEILRPVDEAIAEAINDVIDATPIDEILNGIESALRPIRMAIDAVDRISRVTERLEEILRGLDDAPAQFDAWVDAILAKIAAIGDMSEIELGLADVASALDAVTEAALRTLLDGAYQPASTAFRDARPGDRLANIVQARLRFPDGVFEALPATAERDAIATSLVRVRATDAEFGAPFLAAERIALACRSADGAINTLLPRWDARYHDARAALPGLRRTNATAEDIRSWVEEALEWQVRRPVKTALSFIKPVRVILTATVPPVREMAQSLSGKVASLATGPNSVGAIAASMGQIVDQIRGINIGFVRDGLGEIHAQVRDKLNEVSPATIGQPLQAAFDAMLNDISLDAVIDPAAIEDLDEAYERIIEALKALDPGTLIIDVVQPEFDARLGEIVAAFDLTIVFDAVIEKLNSLKAELETELGRVNESYKAMLAAVPAGIEISLDIDIDVDIGF